MKPLSSVQTFAEDYGLYTMVATWPSGLTSGDFTTVKSTLEGQGYTITGSYASGYIQLDW